jgi:hypothetical protein
MTTRDIVAQLSEGNGTEVSRDLSIDAVVMDLRARLDSWGPIR